VLLFKAFIFNRYGSIPLGNEKKLGKRSKCLDLIIALAAKLRPYLSREIRDRRKAEQSRLTT